MSFPAITITSKSNKIVCGKPVWHVAAQRDRFGIDSLYTRVSAKVHDFISPYSAYLVRR